VTVIWSGRARMRLLQIHDFVAEENPAAAVRVAQRLLARAESLAAFPRRGRLVVETPGVEIREVVEGNYRIVYRVEPARIEIVTVFEAHRRFPTEDVP
jgi:toxin ParE1/3/4